jgi:hypothetical protein
MCHPHTASLAASSSQAAEKLILLNAPTAELLTNVYMVACSFCGNLRPAYILQDKRIKETL